MEIFVDIAMPDIETTIADHLKVLFRDMPDQTFDQDFEKTVRDICLTA